MLEKITITPTGTPDYFICNILVVRNGKMRKVSENIHKDQPHFSDHNLKELIKEVIAVCELSIKAGVLWAGEKALKLREKWGEPDLIAYLRKVCTLYDA